MPDRFGSRAIRGLETMNRRWRQSSGESVRQVSRSLGMAASGSDASSGFDGVGAFSGLKVTTWPDARRGRRSGCVCNARHSDVADSFAQRGQRLRRLRVGHRLRRARQELRRQLVVARRPSWIAARAVRRTRSARGRRAAGRVTRACVSGGADASSVGSTRIVTRACIATHRRIAQAAPRRTCRGRRGRARPRPPRRTAC